MLILNKKNANKAEKLLKLIAEEKINDWEGIKEVVKDKKLFLHIESRFRLRNYFNFENDSRTKKPSEIEDIKKYDKEIVCDVLEDAIKEFKKEQGNYISTLDCLDLNNIRQSGNSTRQVDFAIQKLFSGCVVNIQEHYHKGHNSFSNEILLKRILKRIYAEHRNDELLILTIKENGKEIFLKFHEKDIEIMKS
jgi:hypothetical protein